MIVRAAINRFLCLNRLSTARGGRYSTVMARRTAGRGTVMSAFAILVNFLSWFVFQKRFMHALIAEKSWNRCSMLFSLHRISSATHNSGWSIQAFQDMGLRGPLSDVQLVRNQCVSFGFRVHRYSWLLCSSITIYSSGAVAGSHQGSGRVSPPWT